jgi:hypothetical protein
MQHHRASIDPSPDEYDSSATEISPTGPLSKFPATEVFSSTGSGACNLPTTHSTLDALHDQSL